MPRSETYPCDRGLRIVLTRTGIIAGVVLLAVAGIALVRLRIGTTATINWTDVRQSIDGFGGSSADFLTGLTPAQADFFFTPAGIGLSMLRTQIIPDLATCNAEFHDGGCSDSNGQSLNGELETAKLAVARGAIVFSTPWSPPGAYKSNGSFRNGGHLLRSHYSDWAQEIATYVTMMANHGVPIYAVSVQNEPDLTTDYGSCSYTAPEMHDFVPYLDSALSSVAPGSTKIMIAEQSSWAFDLTSTAMADPKVAPAVGIVAAHGYRGKIQPHFTGSARLWQTEDSSQSPTYDSSMIDGMSWAVKIHDYLAIANVNAWAWWFLTDMPHQGEGTDNAALTDIHGNIPKRAYVSGQWSKFVRPGWYRVGVGYFGPLRITAFKDPESHSFAIVAVNPSARAVRQTFSLNGFSAGATIPWITSADLSLTAQAPVSVNGSNFAYTLPAFSVITFSGTVTELH
jgi:glucuronoarabinoxylan endo-1,4-beta-xylanase